MTRQYNGRKKTIKSLVSKAEKGILEAQFQLHEYYEKGKVCRKRRSAVSEVS